MYTYTLVLNTDILGYIYIHDILVLGKVSLSTWAILKPTKFGGLNSTPLATTFSFGHIIIPIIMSYDEDDG